MFQDYTNLKYLNVVKKVPFRKFELTKEEIQNLDTRPRTTKNLKLREVVVTPWLFKKSIFSMYRADNASLLNKCFFADWEQIEPNLEMFIKDQSDRRDLKNLLLENYKIVRDSYKYLAG